MLIARSWSCLTRGLMAAAACLLAANAAEPNTRARLLLATESARPGESVLAAVHLQMAKGWHTYWRNPGESGLATTISWDLPAGITAGDIQWPPPAAHESGGLITYVYHDQVLLLVPLTVGPDAKAGATELKATVEWLECKEACVPGSEAVTARLEIGPPARPSAQATLIESWQQRIPRPSPEAQITAAWEDLPAGDTAVLLLKGSVQPLFSPTDFYPYPSDQYEVAPGAKPMPPDPGKFGLLKSVKRLGAQFPDRIPGILVEAAQGDAPVRAVEVALAPDPMAQPKSPGRAAEAPLRVGEAAAKKVSLLAMLGFAFLGGLILNIMPCVLPVIALKILGFVQQSKEAPARVRRLGLMYGVGVLASFLAMAALVLSVQHAGGGASWGMQMQNPFFRLGLLVVVLLVALNLFGVFEVLLGGSAMDAAAKLASRDGYPGAFFNGVLATALGTSCTAPVLAIAVGFAFTQPPAVILLMFLTIGAGLASPYVLLSWNPNWLRFLPKPGAWMQKFKVAMGFPMLGTAVWMFEFTAPSYGPGGVLWLGMFLAVIALTVWVWGEFVQRGVRRKGLAMGVCAALLAGAYFGILESQLHWRNPVGASAALSYVRDTPEGLEWWPWSPAAVALARQDRRVVLVDFTAKWCPNCRSNKKFAIDIPSVRARMQALDALALRADYTDRDPRITEELKRYGRAGVPMVLVFPADPARPPLVLPELLTPAVVLDALDQAGRPEGVASTGR